jgi:antitoxin (DNA-binding transcriptional repressor) of toxin-antitoxin stability system
MTTRISAAEARKNMAAVVQKAQNGERIKLTRYDKTVAVLIPKRDLASLEDCEDEAPPQPRRGSAKRAPAAKKRSVG